MNLKTRKEEKVLEQRKLLNAAKEEKRELNEEEKRAFDQLQDEIDAVEREIQEGEKEEKRMKDNQNAVEEERKRSAQITALCRDHELDPEPYIKGGKGVDAVKSAILDQLMKENQPVSARASITESEEDKFRQAAADALVMRGGVEMDKPAEGAKDLMGMSLRALAEESLKDSGVSNLNLKSTDEIYSMLMERQFYNPTAAFPSILDAAINKAYVQGHQTVPVTFEQFTKKGTLKDFKTVENNYLAGPAGEFLEVPENGEIKHDTPVDVKMPQRKLATYGRQFTMTRQAFINDDIGFLSTIPARYAAAARKTINKQVYDILVNNPAVYDGIALFDDANHKNLITTGTAPDQTSLQAAFTKLQLQKDQFGETVIIRPKYLIVPIGYSFELYTTLMSPTINTTGNTQAVNPLHRYASQIEVIEDPTLNALAGDGNDIPWFIVGDKADTDFIQVDYLNGQEVPTIRRMETPGTLGFIWDIYLDWGVNVMDFRGAIKNPGTTI